MIHRILSTLIFTMLISFGSYSNSNNNKPNQNDKPNIIFIIADQMRGDALGVLDHPNVRTPNLDKLAEQGVVFSNFFTNNPVCAPSRMSFFTGLLPNQHGKLTNRSGEFLQEMEGTMLGYFNDLGYKLGWVGKDHHTYDRSVMDQLDYNVSRARESFRGYTKYVPPYWHSDMHWPVEELHATRNTRDAINFINNTQKDQPFFLTVSYFDPHPPYFAPADYAAHYEVEDIEIPYYIPPGNLSDRLAEQQRALHYDRIGEMDLKQTLLYYYASIEWGVDHQIGKLIKTLQKKGIEENTIVIFTSEHGDFMGQHHMVRKGMFLYDALLHVPFIVYGPGQIEEGIQSSVMASGVDIFPTLVDLTGGEIPSEVTGKSLMPILKGNNMPKDNYTIFASAAYSDLPEGYFENPEPPQYNPPENDDTPFHSRVQRHTWQANQRTIMARTRDWKLIINESRSPELYKMEGDWTEKENVAYKEEYQGVMENLKTRLSEVWGWVPN